MISMKRSFLFLIFFIILSSCLHFNEARRGGGGGRSSSRGSSSRSWGSSSKSHSSSSGGGGFFSRLFGGGSSSSPKSSSSSVSSSSYPKQPSSSGYGSQPSSVGTHYGWNVGSKPNLESPQRINYGNSFSQPGGHIVKPGSAAQPIGWNIPAASQPGSVYANPKPSAPLGNPPPYGSWNVPGAQNTHHSVPLGASNHNYNTNNYKPYGAGYQNTNSYPSNTHYNQNPQYTPGQTYVHNTYYSPSSGGYGSNTYVPIFIPSVHSHHQTYYPSSSYNNQYSRRTSPETVTDKYVPLFNGTTTKPNGRIVNIGKSGFVGAGVVGGVAATGLLYGALTPSKNGTNTVNSTSSTTIQPDLLNSTTTEFPLDCVVGVLVNSTECRKRLASNKSNSTTTPLPDILNTTTEINLFKSDLSYNTKSSDSIIPSTPLDISLVEITTLKTEINTNLNSSEILSARNTLEMIKEVDE